MKQSDIFRKAKMLFSEIGSNVFKNNNEYIYVDNTDISKCISTLVRNISERNIDTAYGCNL